MQPEDLPGRDPNTLPYFITEVQTIRKVPVRFEPLTPIDAVELNNEDWTHAVLGIVPSLPGIFGTIRKMRTIFNISGIDENR